ncbi:MAG TPA: hypothetical protein VIM75_18885, partial [Ohtaekwangia sp.]
MKKCFTLFFLFIAFHLYSQDDAVVLVISNMDCKILLDGIEKGTSKSGSSVRVVTSAGEHYVE